MNHTYLFKELVLGVFQTQGNSLELLCTWRESEPLSLRLDEAGEEEWPLDTFDHLITSTKTSKEETPPFEELEKITEHLKLDGEIENFLWGYPLYRKFIEANIGYDYSIESQWIDEAYRFGKSWSKWISRKLELNHEQTEKLSSMWTRFRSDALKKLGSHPLKSV